MNELNLATIFLTGLLTGGLTCMAVQGGLLTSAIALRKGEVGNKRSKDDSVLILSFLVAKLIAYTLFGFLLGWVGSLFQISQQAQLVFLGAISLFMIVQSFVLLDIHPFFRRFVIQPPRFLHKMIRSRSKKESIFTPALLGAMTVFIPCGSTQAMMALAVASSHPFFGALILAVFVLGTSPVFFVLGYFMTRLGDIWHKRFTQIAGYSIFLLAIWNLNNAVALTGSPYTLENSLRAMYCTFSFCSQENLSVQEKATITITDLGYEPGIIAVPAGKTITLRLQNKDARGCAQAFTIPTLKIQKVVPLGETQEITFVSPQEKGEYAFMCSMGMYRGIIRVI